jgi:cell division initiation protein
MIDLTPLDVRKKRGDFGKGVRGYNAQEVDSFLELVAERLEELVKENLTLKERADRLSEQVTAQTGRERAVHEALVTAQELREEIQGSAQKEAELVIREAESKGRELIAEAELRVTQRSEALYELERRRKRFLASFRQFLEREIDAVTVEEGRAPLQEDPPIDLDLGGGRPVAEMPRAADDVHELAAEVEGEGLFPGLGPAATDELDEGMDR